MADSATRWGGPGENACVPRPRRRDHARRGSRPMARRRRGAGSGDAREEFFRGDHRPSDRRLHSGPRRGSRRTANRRPPPAPHGRTTVVKGDAGRFTPRSCNLLWHEHFDSRVADGRVVEVESFQIRQLGQGLHPRIADRNILDQVELPELRKTTQMDHSRVGDRGGGELAPLDEQAGHRLRVGVAGRGRARRVTRRRSWRCGWSGESTARRA